MYVGGMTELELDKMIRANCPSWLLEEIDDFLGIVKAEREIDPDSWGDYTTALDALETFEGQDWADTRKFKLAMTRIERACGVQVKLGKGEEVQEISCRGSRTFRAGDWVYDKRWDELLTS